MDRVRHYNPNGTWGEYTTPSSDEDISTRSTPNRGHDQNDHKEGEEGPPGEAIDTYEEEMRHMWALAREYKRAWTHLLRDFAAEGSLGHDIGEYYRDVIMNIAVDESQIPDSWYVGSI
ncbi:hypothetical protein BDN72DRAFT_413468 [Pluteus cervinus]|uniref:Uncharacterized protein n=1 Tax=Pluteus cervinus TaxID=181527 RepID=A0ACD3A9G7_9AGAR|nr:hypothetical protein BDN72DRAFT_413468 [Pluteus cervinus]